MKFSISALSCGMLILLFSALPTKGDDVGGLLDALVDNVTDAAGDSGGMMDSTDDGVGGLVDEIMDVVGDVIENVTSTVSTALDGYADAMLAEFNDTMNNYQDFTGCIYDTFSLFTENPDLVTAHQAYVTSYTYTEEKKGTATMMSRDIMMKYDEDAYSAFETACNDVGGYWYVEDGIFECPDGVMTLKIQMENNGDCYAATSMCESAGEMEKEMNAEIMTGLQMIGINCTVSKEEGDGMDEEDSGAANKNIISLGALATAIVGGLSLL